MARQKTRRPIRQSAPTIRLVSNARSSARVPYQMTGGYDNANTRTDIYSVGGYPDTVAFSDLWNAYRRKGLAKVVVELPVNMCWQEPPKIECEDAQFMAAFNTLVEDFALWERMRGLDLRQRVGQYAGLMLVAREGSGARPDAPLKVNSPKAMVKMVPLYESQLEVTNWVTDFSSADYGMPKDYQYTSQVPGARNPGDMQSLTLHPSRVFVFAEGADDGGIYGIPALEACFNALMDAEKIRCGGSEGLFRNAKQRFAIEIDDQQTANGLRDPALKKQFDDNVDDFQKGFDNSLMLLGAKANNLQSSLQDPMPYWQICMNEIAAAMGGFPATIMIGQMTGRLASDEDQKQAAKFIKSRRENTINPMLIRFIQHMVSVGLLPMPRAEIEIEWENLLEATDSEKVDLAAKMATTNKTAMDAGDGPIYTVEEIREAGGYDSLGEDDDLPPENGDMDDAEAAA